MNHIVTEIKKTVIAPALNIRKYLIWRPSARSLLPLVKTKKKKPDWLLHTTCQRQITSNQKTKRECYRNLHWWIFLVFEDDPTHWKVSSSVDCLGLCLLLVMGSSRGFYLALPKLSSLHKKSVSKWCQFPCLLQLCSQETGKYPED